jgi:hypothetical protein
LAAISLVGKAAPELDGAEWLNTDKPKMSLADFRGKFVPTQFLTTWCGVCHWDVPNVELAYDLYKDKGLVVNRSPRSTAHSGGLRPAVECSLNTIQQLREPEQVFAADPITAPFGVG